MRRPQENRFLKHIHSWPFLVISFFALGFLLLAYANRSVDSHAVIETRTEPPDEESVAVTVAGITVLRIRAPQNSSEQRLLRAQVVAERIRGVVTSSERYCNEAQSIALGNSRLVTIRGHTIVTVDDESAHANHTTTHLLGRTWASNLNDALNSCSLLRPTLGTVQTVSLVVLITIVGGLLARINFRQQQLSTANTHRRALGTLLLRVQGFRNSLQESIVGSPNATGLPGISKDFNNLVDAAFRMTEDNEVKWLAVDVGKSTNIHIYTSALALMWKLEQHITNPPQTAK